MTYIDEIADYMATNGIGTVGSNIFVGYLPGDSPVVGVFDTGGLEPDTYVPIHHPTFQVLVVNKSFTDGQAKLDAVRTLLHGVENETIGSHYYYYIFAQSEGGHIGQDDIGRHQFSINFRCKTR